MGLPSREPASFRVPRGEEQRSRRMATERFGDFLRRKALVFTRERQAVIHEFYSIHEHIEAEELQYRLRQSDLRVSRATVYRTLDLLVQAGLARRVRLGRHRHYYEHILGRAQHEHMICTGCERVIEWFDPELRELLARNFEERGFEPVRTSLQVFGYCSECVDGRAVNDSGGEWSRCQS